MAAHHLVFPKAHSGFPKVRRFLEWMESELGHSFVFRQFPAVYLSVAHSSPPPYRHFNWSGTIQPGNFAASGSTNIVGMASRIASGGVGFVSSAVVLDLEPAAMEKGGYGKVVSRPRVLASDRQQARIVKGSEVPYQQSAGDGATSVSFKKAARCRSM